MLLEILRKSFNPLKIGSTCNELVDAIAQQASTVSIPLKSGLHVIAELREEVKQDLSEFQSP